MGKHLTLDERMEIQLALKQGKSFKETHCYRQKRRIRTRI